jgi:hypothetical protein
MKKKNELPPGLALVADSASVYADRHAVLCQRVAAVEIALRRLKREHIRGIKSAVLSMAEARAALEEAIKAAKPQFAKPRTRTLHGVTVGFRKLIGKLTFSDAADVVKRIKQHFPAMVKVLVQTVEVPVKEAIEQLPAADLKRIGCEISESGDQLVCKMAGTDVEKVVAALLHGEEEAD